MTGKLQVIVGGQAGSEGKGAVAAYLAHPSRAETPTVVRVGGSQAGHTVIGRCPDSPDKCTACVPAGHPWRLRHVPVGMVTNPDAVGLIAAGSEIDVLVLTFEIEALQAAGYQIASRLHLDPEATIIQPKHIDAEAYRALTQRLGSTGKGVGAARVDRIWRLAELAREARELPVQMVDTARVMRQALRDGQMVQVEGVQGYSLGLHAGDYPYCTSSDCRAIDFLAMAGISPWARHVARFEVWVAARVYPIRVAGNSGPMAHETTWEDLGLPPELTTVTRKVRRVGHWDPDQVAVAVEANGGPSPDVKLALTMVDQKHPEVAGVTRRHALSADALQTISDVEMDTSSDVHLVGTGPQTMVEMVPIKPWRG